MSGQHHEPSSAGAALAVLALAVLVLLAGCTRTAHRRQPAPPPATPPALFTAGAGAPPSDVKVCTHAGCIAAGPIPADATCFQLVNHAANDPVAPFLIQPAEGVTCFYYDVPWVEPSGLVAWQTQVDAPAMREWQLLTSSESKDHGAVEGCVGGGDSEGGLLLMAHPTGSNDVLMPEGVGLRLPAPGTRIVLQWHFLNEGGAAVRDASKVTLCTRPTSRLERTAGLTVLGTENIGSRDEGIGLGKQSVDGACTLGGEQSVRLFMVAPHMNRLGRHLRMSVQRANGSAQPFFDVDFSYDRQLMRETEVVLHPGDRVTTRCTYDNDTGVRVPFTGSLQSFKLEQCYVYAISEPAGALDAATPSALGVANTCWSY